jgi:hypothetical protein
VAWTDSWLSIAGAGCGLICVVASEERAQKVYALRGLWGVERQVGSACGTRWPAGSSAGRMMARKARWSHGQEPVQGSGSWPEFACGVCGGSPQNHRVTWLSHKTKTGGSAGGDGIRVHREASMSADAWRDRRACVERTRSAATAWLCDEEECYMTYLTLRGLYHKLSAMGSVVFCLAQEELIYISSRVSRQTILPDYFAFPCCIGLDFSSVCKESGLRVNGSFHGCVDFPLVAHWVFFSFLSYFRWIFVRGLFLRFWGVWVRICWWESLIVALCIFVLDQTPQTPNSTSDWRISVGNLALFLSSVESRILSIHWVWGYKFVGIASPRGASSSPMIW